MKDRAPLVESRPPDAFSTAQTPDREPPLRLADIA